jgi:SNF2 family DNA or RNA helicase
MSAIALYSSLDSAAATVATANAGSFKPKRMSDSGSDSDSQGASGAEGPLKPLWSTFNYFPHQLEGIRWMLDKERNGTLVPGKKSELVLVRGGMQCDEMGHGKTIQIVATILNNPLPLTVLLAPVAMIETWTGVCQRAGLIVYHAVGPDWFLLSNTNAPVTPVAPVAPVTQSVYLTNSEKIYTTPRLFRHLSIDRVVIDEAHKLRNPSGQMAIYARRLGSHGTIRWAVTGTPLVNKWEDVISLLAFIGVPYSPLFHWEQRYEDMLPSLVLHRSLESIRSTLPAPPYPIIQHIALPFVSQEEQEFYLAIQGNVLAQATSYDMDRLTPQQAFLLLLRLRQISVHPQIYISAKRRESSSYLRKDWIGPSTKLLAIRDIIIQDFLQLEQQTLQLQQQEPHKYIIFCQFMEEIELIQDYLLSLGLFSQENILQYHGSMTMLQRDTVLQYSKRTLEPTVLLLQLQAGGVGLNLQEYDRILFVSPWWTSALIDQAIARAVRMGQTRVVHVYHLLLLVEHEQEQEQSQEQNQSSPISIDALIHSKAEEKREMLNHFFQICHPLEEIEEEGLDLDLDLDLEELHEEEEEEE